MTPHGRSVFRQSPSHICAGTGSGPQGKPPFGRFLGRPQAAPYGAAARRRPCGPPYSLQATGSGSRPPAFGGPAGGIRRNRLSDDFACGRLSPHKNPKKAPLPPGKAPHFYLFGLQPLFPAEIPYQQHHHRYRHYDDDRITVFPAQLRHVKIHPVPPHNKGKR